MPRETQTEKNSNPLYFESVQCSAEGCQSSDDLLRHRYTEEYMCCSCVNKLIENIFNEKEAELDEFYGYGDSDKKEIARSDLLNENNLNKSFFKRRTA